LMLEVRGKEIWVWVAEKRHGEDANKSV
jgi:hypothetical protein